MAAQDAELKLKVSLDLAFFRQQLAGLGQAAAGYQMPINVKFDRLAVQGELNKLGENIRRRTYRLNIETNLSAEISKADTLARKLDELSKKIKPAATSGASSGKRAIADIEEVLRGGLSGRAFGIQQAQENIARQAILSRLEKKSLSAGGYNVKGLEKIIKDLGGTPSGGRADLVVQAKKLVQEADGITEAVFDNLKNLQMKLRPIRGQAQTSAARSMPNLNEMLDRIANLTSNPRAAQRMLRALPESRITTNLVGAANRQAAFQQQYPGGFTTPAFAAYKAPKAFDPLLKAIQKDFTEYSKTINTTNPWIGKTGSVLADLLTKGVMSSAAQQLYKNVGGAQVRGQALLPAAGQTSASRMTRSMFANLPALQAPGIGTENAPLSRAAQYMIGKARRALELPIGPYSPYSPNPFAGAATVPSRRYFQPTGTLALPAAGQTSGALSALEARLGATRGMLGTGGGLTTSLFSGRGLVNPGVSMLGPVGISGNYRQMAAALANQAANPALAHRQIADIGFGAVPTSATGLSGQALNRALNQAFFQRRGLGAFTGQTAPIFQTQGVPVQGMIPGMAYRMGPMAPMGQGGSMGQFPMAGMMGPSTPLTINARTSMFGGGGGGMQPPGGGGGGGMGGFGRGMGNFGRGMGNVNLPGANTIRELGSEFGNATKQVLLFGTAYKALAFLTGFPMQVGQAVGALQSFNNTLKAVSPTAQEAKASNDLILSLVEKYNVPLQSARDGFTKLYASMAPAGFKGEDIRNIFTGISKATAAFGLSADKVDRVNYAFAQMASKGQVMSEELKGQLGDVLPGAMAIFAEAAGFKGPDAIQKFSKALEDGAYKGEAMKVLLQNVGVVMNKEFGPGAEGAARTFQGAMNRIQNSMTLLYESFEPVAVGFLNSVVTPLTAGVKTLTDGFNSFFTQTAAKTSGGFALAQELEKLRPAFEGIKQNVASVIATLGQMAKVGLELGKILLQIAGSPLIGYLARVYAIILPLNIALGVMRGLWASNAIQLLVFQARIIAGTSTLSAFRSMMQTTGMTATATGAAIRGAFASTVIGAVLVGLGLLVEKFMSMNAALEETKNKALGAAQAIRAMSSTEARVSEQQTASVIRDLQKLQASKEDMRLNEETVVTVPKDVAARLTRAGIPVKQDLLGRNVLERAMIPSYLQQQEQIKSEAAFRQSQIKFDEQQARTPAALQPIPPGEGDEKALKAQQKALEDARKAADDKRKYEADLMKIGAQQAIDLDEMQFEHWKNLQQAKYDFLEAGQNEWMSREIKFQRDLQAIEIRRIEAIRKARVDTLKAETEMQAKAYIAGQDITGTTGLLQGSTGISSGPHFDVRRADGGRITEAEARALFDASVRQRLQMTSGYGPRNTGIPGASTFHRGIDLAGPANTPLNLAPGYSLKGVGLEGGLGYAASVLGPQGQTYKVGHLQKPQAGLSPARMRTEAKQDYAASLAGQEAINAKEKESLQTKYANIQAQLEINNLIKEYVASIAPVEPQRLENTLLKNRIDLMSSGVFGEALDMEQKISEARNKTALGVQMANKQIEENNRLAEANNITKEEAARLNAIESDRINQLNQQLSEYIPLLRERLSLEQQSAEAGLAGQIQRATPLGGMGLAGGFIGESATKFEEALGRGATVQAATKYAELQNQLTLLEERNKAIQQSILGIGDAFGTAMTSGVASLVDGTATAKEVFADFLKSVGQTLLQAAGQMISTYVAIGIAKIFAGLGGGGGAGGLEPNTAAGNAAFMQRTGALGFANGGVAKGGFVPFKAFADGGTVSGPTLGLVGEGKYNEAIVPLPDGRSIPVSMKGGRSARDLMGNNAPGMPQAPTLNMKFETTRINGVEYVSKEQLEQAMAETRRSAIAGGARQGMELTLDRIKQSPSTRARVGIR